jgi:transposase-like protein
VAAQGYATRYRIAGPDDVTDAIRRLSAVQLDSISVVARSHRLISANLVGTWLDTLETTLLKGGAAIDCVSGQSVRMFVFSEIDRTSSSRNTPAKLLEYAQMLARTSARAHAAIVERDDSSCAGLTLSA